MTVLDCVDATNTSLGLLQQNQDSFGGFDDMDLDIGGLGDLGDLGEDLRDGGDIREKKGQFLVFMILMGQNAKCIGVFAFKTIRAFNKACFTTQTSLRSSGQMQHYGFSLTNSPGASLVGSDSNSTAIEGVAVCRMLQAQTSESARGSSHGHEQHREYRLFCPAGIHVFLFLVIQPHSTTPAFQFCVE